MIPGESKHTPKENFVKLISSDNKEILVDINSIKNKKRCSTVLLRFLGELQSDQMFMQPEKDKQGRLLFLQTFDIERKDFMNCINYIKTGEIHLLNKLTETYNILGGCDELDKIIEKKQKKKLKEEEGKLMNPLYPHDDINNLFDWQMNRNYFGISNPQWIASANIGDGMCWFRKIKGTSDDVSDDVAYDVADDIVDDVNNDRATNDMEEFVVGDYA